MSQGSTFSVFLPAHRKTAADEAKDQTKTMEMHLITDATLSSYI